VNEERNPFDFGSNAPAAPGWAPPPGAVPAQTDPLVRYGTDRSTAAWPPPVSPGDPVQGGDAFAATRAVGSAPIAWLVAALVAGAAGAVLAGFWGAQVVFAMAGWVLSGPGAIGMLAVFSQRDVRQRALPVYLSSSGRTKSLYTAAIVVAGIGIGISAWYIALWAGRL
jgi:hypothetical protein